MRAITLAVLFVMLGVAIEGCASKVSGHRLEQVNYSIDKLNYVIFPVQLNDQFRKHLQEPTRELTTLLVQRTPLVFALNGIEIGHQGDIPWTLVFSPKYISEHATRNRPMLVLVKLDVYIASTVNRSRRIWEGEATYGYLRDALPDEKTVDDFANEILLRLASDGMLKLNKRN